MDNSWPGAESRSYAFIHDDRLPHDGESYHRFVKNRSSGPQDWSNGGIESVKRIFHEGLQALKNDT
jgi:hypothetical protein